MQFLQASEIFKDIGNLYSSEFETAKDIMLDFANVENIDLKGITALLNVQKVALMNNKSVMLKNVTPSVGKILDVTGLNKMFSDSVSNLTIGK